MDIGIAVIPRLDVPTGKRVTLRVNPPLYDGQDPFMNGFDIEPEPIAP